MPISLSINGQPVQAPEGDSVLDAINASGTYISQLCKDPDMKPVGACRTCLVQIEGRGGLPAACSVPATEGMQVWTDTAEVRRIRSGVLELTLGMVSDGQDYRQLTDAAQQHGIRSARWQPRQRQRTDDSNPIFNLAMDSCILCARCVNACQESHQFIGAIDFLGAGRQSRIGTFMDQPLIDSICTTCGQCLSVCPTGAIQVKTPPTATDKSVTTTCPYCGVGCGIKLQVGENHRIQEALDDPENLSSMGMLCVKGRFGYTYVHHPDRLTTPLIKENGQFRPAGWDEALELIADRLLRHRDGSFGTLCSAKATNEDGYVQQKFARLVMQTNNIDHCTRLCHAPSVAAMLSSLGSGATSNSYTDYEDAGCLLVIGCDPTSNHPVAASRMRRAVVERGARLIVINPRRIDLCDYADLWLRPYPGTDVALLNSLAQVILDEGLEDTGFIEARTEGFDEWAGVVNQYNPARAEEITGVSADDIRQAARLYARPPVPSLSPETMDHPEQHKAASGAGIGGSCLIWGMGITQHTNGTANAHGLLNLALVAGQLGKRGAGVSPLRGQNNVQGCGDAGCLPDSLPGYQGLGRQTLGKFSKAWGDPVMPDNPGLVVTEMVECIGQQGGIRAMYVTGENPLLSEPDLNHAAEKFSQLEFLVVQDIFLHETAQIADVVLPAASFAEKDGTFTNSERRVQRVRQAVAPVGQSRPDWEIICDLARRMCRTLGLPLEEQFTYSHPSAIFDEMAGLTPMLAGISYPRLDREGGIQWPCTSPDHPGTPFLYADGFPRGPRARFVPFEQGPMAAETPDRRFPLILNTGRTLYHWHGGTLTTRVAALLARAPELQVAISPQDGAKYGLTDGQQVRVRSRRGELTGQALFTERMRAGEIFIPFVKLQESAANFLTHAVYDPDAKIPEYKVCAVRVQPAE